MKKLIKELNFEILENMDNINCLNNFISNKKEKRQNKKNKQNHIDFNYKYSNNNIYYKSEIALWKAVILQALVDLQSNSKKKIANTYRIKALMWFNLKNKDFLQVCNWADLDPKYVYEKAQIIKNNSSFLI